MFSKIQPAYDKIERYNIKGAEVVKVFVQVSIISNMRMAA